MSSLVYNIPSFLIAQVQDIYIVVLLPITIWYGWSILFLVLPADQLTNLLAFTYSIYGRKVWFQVDNFNSIVTDRNCFVLKLQFYTRETILENLSSERNATNIMYIKINMFSNTSLFVWHLIYSLVTKTF